jgi:hypothetical protein
MFGSMMVQQNLPVSRDGLVRLARRAWSGRLPAAG